MRKKLLYLLIMVFLITIATTLPSLADPPNCGWPGFDPCPCQGHQNIPGLGCCDCYYFAGEFFCDCNNDGAQMHCVLWGESWLCLDVQG